MPMAKKMKFTTTSEGNKKKEDVEETEVVETEETETVTDEGAEDTEGTEDSTSTDEETDYEEIIRQEREMREKAESALAKKAFDAREARRKETDETGDEDDIDDGKPISRKELDARLAAERAAARKEAQEEQALEIARANTKSEGEAQAAHIFWKNRVVPTGNLVSDVLFAIGGLNHKKVIARNVELGRALLGKEGASKGVTTAVRDTEVIRPKLDAATEASYRRSGLTYDPKIKMWKKKMPNGKWLVKDPKSKQFRPLK